jgi:type II secretory pathway pseudopilin PulG
MGLNPVGTYDMRHAPLVATPERRHAAAFTIVELLVVVSIVTLLMAILAPAVMSARESSRIASCSAQQVRIAMAVSRYESAKSFLPGTVSQATTWGNDTKGQLNWFAVLLPYLDRNEIFQLLDGGAAAPTDVFLPEAMCPSADHSTTAGGSKNRMGYGINAGTAHVSGSKSHDGAVISNLGAERKSLDDIRVRDGLANTWLACDFTAGKDHKGWPLWTAGVANGLIGASRGGVVQFGSSRAIAATNPRPVLNDWGPPGSEPILLNSSPPRSRHPSGCVFTFCDGRAKFLKDDIAPRVFAQLSTSHSVWTGSTYDSNVNSSTVRNWLLHNPTNEPQPFKPQEGVNY